MVNNFQFMDFSRQKIYLVIALTVLSLIGIVVVQYYWIDAAYNMQQEQFDQQLATISQDIEKSIQSDEQLYHSLLAYSNDYLPSLRSYVYNLPEPLALEIIDTSSTLPNGTDLLMRDDLIRKLDGIIDSVFTEHNINIEYHFGLVNHHSTCLQCGDDSKDENIIIANTSGDDLSAIIKSEYKTSNSAFMGFGHINFHFPSMETFITKQIGWMLGLSIIGILIIVGCFGYTILTIRKQKKLAEMKNDFINNMTHEFKTPIFSISLASKALGKSQQLQQSEKLTNYLNLINDESKRLKNQVDKVLEMTLAESGFTKINKEKVNLHELIKNEADKFELILSERDGTINLDLNAERYIIYADKTHLANIIQNLIDNAIKYSENKPKITISTENSGKEDVSFSITDNGIGMDSETKQHVFEKFYRAPTGDIHDVKGFGLGLSYVKNIVNAHKGRIKLNSKINKGSTFTIILPA